MDINHSRYENFLIEIEELQNEIHIQEEATYGVGTFRNLQSELEEEILYYDNLIPKCKTSDEELFPIFNYLIKNKMILGNFEDFSLFCKKLRNTKPLNWIDKKGYNAKSKVVTYVLLFDLLHNIIFQEPKHFEGLKKRMFLENICEGSLFDVERKNFNLLNTAYSSWKK